MDGAGCLSYMLCAYFVADKRRRKIRTMHSPYQRLGVRWGGGGGGGGAGVCTASGR
jgi:hypothetical protein